MRNSDLSHHRASDCLTIGIHDIIKLQDIEIGGLNYGIYCWNRQKSIQNDYCIVR